MQDPLQDKFSSNIQRVAPSLAPGDFLPLRAGKGDVGRWLLPLDPLGHPMVALGSVQVGLMALVVPLRFSLPSVCGPEVPEMNLPQKSSARPVQLMLLLKKRGVLARVISLIDQKLSS